MRMASSRTQEVTALLFALGLAFVCFGGAVLAPTFLTH
jgi:hypothetical protein